MCPPNDTRHRSRIRPERAYAVLVADDGDGVSEERQRRVRWFS
jgi:hypothetical protein